MHNLQFSTAIDETLSKFNTKNIEISDRCGLLPSRISRLRAGHSIHTKGLEQMLNALTEEEFQFFIGRLIADRGFYIVKEAPSEVEALFKSLTDEEIADTLSALAQKIRSQLPIAESGGLSGKIDEASSKSSG